MGSRPWPPSTTGSAPAGWGRRRAARTASTSRQLGAWAAGRDLGPHELGHRELRRFAAVLGESGAAKTTVARKLAAIRSFYRHLVERGELESNPADLVSSPKKDSYLPQVLKPGEVAELLERIPATSPLDLRDRAMFELAYAAGLRAEELTKLDTDQPRPRRRAGARGGQGRPHARRPGRRARLARAGPLPDPRQAALDCGDSDALFLSKSGRRLSTSDVRRRLSSRPAASASPRTRCATRSPPTCWRAAPTCARSRSCWAMRPSARPRRTLG